MIKEREIFGYIYKIYHPKILQVGHDGQPFQPCYVGKTEDSLKKRFAGHKRDAQKVAGSSAGGDGKLHAIMWANKPETFKIEVLAVAHSPEELSQKESDFIKKFDTIKQGWNKITASSTKTKRGQKVSIILAGKTLNFESNAHLCRQLEIGASSLTHWLKKGLSLSDSVSNALVGKENDKIKKSQTIEVYKRTYASINEVARDKKINKLNLTATLIRRRIKAGLSPEDALSKPKEKGIESLTLKLPNNQTMTFSTVTEAHEKLTSSELTTTKYQTVVSYLKKGYTPEQAFGLEMRPWELKYVPLDQLVAQQGYEYVGKKNPFADPVVVDHEKKIYPSIKDFAKTYGLDYTTVSGKVKKGVSIPEILKQSGHI